jgi:hypothetical protein
MYGVNMQNVINDVAEVRTIGLPNGGSLEVQLTDAIFDRIRNRFNLLPNAPVEDDHVRMYVYDVVNTAITKAERGEVEIQT